MEALAIGATIAAAVMFAASTWQCLTMRAERRRRAQDQARIVELEATLSRYSRIDEILTEAREGAPPRRTRGHLRLLGVIPALLAAKHVTARSAVAAGAAAATLTAGTWTLDEGHMPTHPTPPAEAETTTTTVGQGAETGANVSQGETASPAAGATSPGTTSPDPTTTTTVPPATTTTAPPPATTSTTTGAPNVVVLNGEGCVLHAELAGIALKLGRCTRPFGPIHLDQRPAFGLAEIVHSP